MSTTNHSKFDFQVGDALLLSDAVGVVCFIGNVHWDKQVYVGLELCDPFEKGHDGLVDNVRYYSCENGKGKMITADSVVRSLSSKELLEKVVELNSDVQRYRTLLIEANNQINNFTMTIARLKKEVEALTEKNASKDLLNNKQQNDGTKLVHVHSGKNSKVNIDNSHILKKKAKSAGVVSPTTLFSDPCESDSDQNNALVSEIPDVQSRISYERPEEENQVILPIVVSVSSLFSKPSSRLSQDDGTVTVIDHSEDTANVQNSTVAELLDMQTKRGGGAPSSVNRKISFANGAAKRFASQVNKKLNEARQTPTLGPQSTNTGIEDDDIDTDILTIEKLKDSNNDLTSPSLGDEKENSNEELVLYEEDTPSPKGVFSITTTKKKSNSLTNFPVITATQSEKAKSECKNITKVDQKNRNENTLSKSYTNPTPKLISSSTTHARNYSAGLKNSDESTPPIAKVQFVRKYGNPNDGVSNRVITNQENKTRIIARSNPSKLSYKSAPTSPEPGFSSKHTVLAEHILSSGFPMHFTLAKENTQTLNTTRLMTGTHSAEVYRSANKRSRSKDRNSGGNTETFYVAQKTNVNQGWEESSDDNASPERKVSINRKAEDKPAVLLRRSTPEKNNRFKQKKKGNKNNPNDDHDDNLDDDVNAETSPEVVIDVPRVPVFSQPSMVQHATVGYEEEKVELDNSSAGSDAEEVNNSTKNKTTTVSPIKVSRNYREEIDIDVDENLDSVEEEEEQKSARPSQRLLPVTNNNLLDGYSLEADEQGPPINASARSYGEGFSQNQVSEYVQGEHWKDRGGTDANAPQTSRVFGRI